MTLITYTIHYTTTSSSTAYSLQYEVFCCQAEDEDHAFEQLQNAHPDVEDWYLEFKEC